MNISFGNFYQKEYVWNIFKFEFFSFLNANINIFITSKI
jgi:hypothetical protein